MTNQIRSLEKNLDKNDYATYGIDSTICNAQQSLKQIKQLTIEEKKAELDKIQAKLNNNEQENVSKVEKIKTGIVFIVKGLCCLGLGYIVGGLFGKIFAMIKGRDFS